MANSAIRTLGKITVHCDACGSEGTSPVLKLTKLSDAEADAAREAQAGKVADVRAIHNRRIAALVAKRKTGVNVDAEIKAQMADTAAKLSELAAGEPKIMRRLRVDACPWCAAPLNVDVVDAEPAAA